MSMSERDAVVTCLTDMLQVLEPDAVSAVAESLSFQKSVATWKDVVQSLPSSAVTGQTAVSVL